MKSKYLCLILTGIMIIGFSCGKKEVKEDEKGFQFDENAEQKEVEIAKSFIYMFPSPGEVLEKFYEANLQFNSEVLHDPRSIDLYVSSKKKALNLGIYLTDMAYTAIFSRSNEAVALLNVVSNLSGEVGVSTGAFESLVDRAKRNIGVGDSLVTICNEVFYNMVEFLESSGKENTVAVITSAAYIEAMYIALESIGEYESNHPIIMQIEELKDPMDNLLSHAEEQSEDPNVKSIILYIEELNSVFAELEAEIIAEDDNEEGETVLTGSSSPELTRENFYELKEMVTRIRKQIISK